MTLPWAGSHDLPQYSSKLPGAGFSISGGMWKTTAAVAARGRQQRWQHAEGSSSGSAWKTVAVAVARRGQQQRRWQCAEDSGSGSTRKTVAAHRRQQQRRMGQQRRKGQGQRQQWCAEDSSCGGTRRTAVVAVRGGRQQRAEDGGGGGVWRVAAAVTVPCNSTSTTIKYILDSTYDNLCLA